MRRPRTVIAPLAFLFLAGCASASLRDAKNAYNRGDFGAAQAAARRLGEDPQARLIAARAGARLAIGEDGTPAPDALDAVAADLKPAARGYPFAEEWANRELAAGMADWLMGWQLPELASLFYRAGLEAPGEDPQPAEQALAEGALQAGLESLDRWESEGPAGQRELRDLERLAEGVLDDTGLPYPPGLADQALRVAWHQGRYREARLFGAAGWLRAVAQADAEGASVLQDRMAGLVFRAWREAGDPAIVTLLEQRWQRVASSWTGREPPVSRVR